MRGKIGCRRNGCPHLLDRNFLFSVTQENSLSTSCISIHNTSTSCARQFIGMGAR